MGFIDEMKAKARANKKTIVLPESEDERTYKAAEAVLKEEIANVVIVGSEEEVAKTPSALTNQSYTSYMLDVANKGGPLEILMAVLACAWSYQVIGEHHVKVPGAVEHPLYGEWVQGYSSKEYADSTKEIIDCVDALGENITPEQEAYLTDIFVKCSRYEKLFWDMAYAMEM